MTQEQRGRKDLVEYPIQDNLRLDVYWRDDKAGFGPAASVYAYDKEVLRLDCFGEAKKQGGKGHCHMNLEQTGGRQWMYPPGSVTEHIDHAIHDLRQNLNFCLVTNPDEKIQEIKVSSKTIEPIAEKAEKDLRAFAGQLELP